MNPPRPPLSPYYTEDHEAFRAQVRKFVDKECAPNIEKWEKAEELPRELHKKAAEAGILGIGLDRMAGFDRPERYPDREAHLALARLIISRDAAGAHQMAEELLGRAVAALAPGALATASKE